MLARIASVTGLLGRLRTAWKQDVRSAVDPLRSELGRLVRHVEQLDADLKATGDRAARAERQAEQLRLLLRLNEQQQRDIASLPALLDTPAVVAHVRRAILAAPLQLEPYPHLVVDNLLPQNVYRLLLKAIPPPAFFGDRDPIKQNVRIPIEFGPTLASQVWQFIDDVVARDAIRPAVLEAFDTPLRAHYERLFGDAQRDRAEGLPQAVSGGRLMLRRPGYYLAPHRDPKRSMITCLLYLARPGDNEAYGTEIYRVVDDTESSYTQTYYPGEEGRRCELVTVVPFRANSMMVFLNSYGAHGARIPAEAPAATERYSYQFYLGPEREALETLIKDLPADRQAMWRSKAN